MEWRWRKAGLIFRPADQFPWMISHAQVPFAEVLDAQRLRVYFGTRDKANRTVAAAIDLQADAPHTILRLHDRPVLDLGALGAFDDSGAMPSWIVDLEDRKLLYYTGWNTTGTVPYKLGIGVAVSSDGGLTFERLYGGPLLSTHPSEPYWCAQPSVMNDGGLWRMWYLSCSGWKIIHGRPEPLYRVKYAESQDGLDWRLTGRVCIDTGGFTEAVGRPCVLKVGEGYRMFYSFRSATDYRNDPSQSYRLGYAESSDGIHWQRRDAAVGISPAKDGWDSQMIEYCHVCEHAGSTYLFYNGNGFGRSGFGYAVLEPA